MRMMRPPLREENISEKPSLNQPDVEPTTTIPVGYTCSPTPTGNICSPTTIVVDNKPSNVEVVEPPYNLGFTKELKIESSVTVTTKKGGFYKFSVMETRETTPETDIEQAKKDMFDKLNSSLDDQLMELRDAGII